MTRSISSSRVVSDWRSPTAPRAYGSQGAHGWSPSAIASAHGSASSVPATKNDAGQLTSSRYASGRMRGRASATKFR